jgi:hypothetical protein
MYKIVSPFYLEQKVLVDTYFIEYKKNLEKAFVISGDRLLIRGNESIVPGILQKTLDSLNVIKSEAGGIARYDFIVRSNISTIINFKNLRSFIENNPGMNYFGGNLFQLRWLDPSSGIIDQTWFGTWFSQGTLIGLSRKLCKSILECSHTLHFEVVDDVAIGIYYRENFYDGLIHGMSPNQFIQTHDTPLTTRMISKIHKKLSPVGWRNKSLNREIDINNMKKIVNLLSSLI